MPIFLIGCKTVKPLLNPRPITLADFVETKLMQCKVKEEFQPLLDSIINSVNNCPSYDNKQIGYIISTYKNSLDQTEILVSNFTRLDFYDYSNSKGIFWYQGYQFVLEGFLPERFIESIGRYYKVYYINPIVYHYWVFDTDDEYFHSYWGYLLSDKGLICQYYNNCGTLWEIDSKPDK
jgi:hypothetical protein